MLNPGSSTKQRWTSLAKKSLAEHKEKATMSPGATAFLLPATRLAEAPRRIRNALNRMLCTKVGRYLSEFRLRLRIRRIYSVVNQAFTAFIRAILMMIPQLSAFVHLLQSKRARRRFVYSAPGNTQQSNLRTRAPHNQLCPTREPLAPRSSAEQLIRVRRLGTADTLDYSLDRFDPPEHDATQLSRHEDSITKKSEPPKTLRTHPYTFYIYASRHRTRTSRIGQTGDAVR